MEIVLRGISHRFSPDCPVLQDVNLTIAAGDLFFLLGPSGCGKTTLLRLLAGFLQPETGEILFGGENVTRLAPEKRETAMVFQNYALWPHMTVAENVRFGLDVQGISAAQKKERVQKVLDLVGLGKLMTRPVPALSGGQQQRVALARALVVEPRVLLLDEPLSNLDARLRIEMRSEIRQICKQLKLTAIYVTHDQKEALSMADRLAVLHAGKVQQVGTPRTVYRRPCNQQVAEFIGEGAFFPATVTKWTENGLAELDTPLGMLHSTTVAAGEKTGQAGTIMLRPECIQPAPDNTTKNTFEAEVEDFVFLGEMGQWWLRVGETRLTAFELRPPVRPVGSRSFWQVTAEDVVFLKD